jgi:hypothetical protein
MTMTPMIANPERGHALTGLTKFGDKSERSRNPKDDCKKMTELFNEPERYRLAISSLDLVWAEFREPPPRFGSREAVVTALDASKRFVDAQLVDLHSRAIEFGIVGTKLTRKHRGSLTDRLFVSLEKRGSLTAP